MKNIIKSGMGGILFCLAIILTTGFLWNKEEPFKEKIPVEKEIKKMPLPVRYEKEERDKKNIKIRVVSLPPILTQKRTEPSVQKLQMKKRKRVASKNINFHNESSSLSRKELLALGETLLQKRDNQKFPIIRSDYLSLGQFSDYFSHLVNIGARFFLADKNEHILKAEIISLVAGNEFLEKYPTTNDLVLSRPRKIIGDSSVKPILRRARFEFGSGDYSIVMFLKKCHDARIVGRIFQKIENDMVIHYTKFDHFSGNYKFKNGMLSYNVVKGILNNGRDIPLGLRFYLTKKCV